MSCKHNFLHGEGTSLIRVDPYRFCSGGTLDKPSSGYRFRHRLRLAAPIAFAVVATQRPSLSTSSQWCVREKHMTFTFRNFNDIHLHFANFLNGYQLSIVMADNLPPHHGSTGPSTSMFHFCTFHQEIHLNPGVQKPPICLMDMMIYTAIVFPGNLRGILKNLMFGMHTYGLQIHVQLLPLDSIPSLDSLHSISQKKQLETMIFISKLWHPEFSSSRRFFVWEAVLLSGSKFWFEGKMLRVYW